MSNGVYCYTKSVHSCGTVDGAYGPVKNPWQYQFRGHPSQADEHAQSFPSGLQSASHIQRASQHVRDYHVSSSSSGSTNPVHVGCSSQESTSDTDVDVSDWYITGGSSGGSAVAVATGVAFA